MVLGVVAVKRRSLLDECTEERAARFDPEARRKKPFSIPPSRQRSARAELSEIKAERAWSKLRPIHAVAFWAEQFERVYGVAPEISSKEYAAASAAASSLARERFDGDLRTVCRFVGWTWDREEEREAWRRKNGKSGGVVGWRLQFSKALQAEWKIDTARTARAGSSPT